MIYIDLSHTLSHQMAVFPGETTPSIVKDILPDHVGYVTHRIETNMHTGTHIDAPFHAKSGLLTIDKYPLELFSGPAIVIDVQGLTHIKMSADWKNLFEKFKIVLFYTGYSQKWGSEEYYYDYPEFDSTVAEALVESGVQIAGFDSPSPDKSPFNFHSIFLKENRFLIENLTNLDKLAGLVDVQFVAFPLKIEAEASLIRAVAMVKM